MNTHNPDDELESKNTAPDDPDIAEAHIDELTHEAHDHSYHVRKLLEQRRGIGEFPYEHPADLLEVPVATATPEEPAWENVNVYRKRETAREAGGQRIYISGPMRGFPDLNHPAFDSLQRALEQEGWTVHSPAQMNRQHGHDESTKYSVAIRFDVEALLDSDAIVFLPGWRQSEGARFEAEIARSLELNMYEADVLGNDEHDGFRNIWRWTVKDPADLAVEGIDQTARRLVYGERAATYGHPKGDFKAIGRTWAALLEQHLGTEIPDIPPEVVGIMMASLKLCRLAATPSHRDSQVDGIGYLLCAARCQEDPAEIQAWDDMTRRARDDAGTADG